ncbi:sugar ABC transporter substrate-binding protein [Verminephrobacter aporrectodeae subsp. tuberculatae]|uniref:Sugar ABC transporter substrate-binding protein n=1 Tax=Verminephrobacter aporrectodeae subsp. tuberculatae TaxID=1110392 RepID=A0ABT3KP04_9BURK|nr:sugar ABC transporter substrate-binding protein [Verminephrobacter aporrectodeae]MCW5221268.1 sugar ABC transporter substrate-binding protein [Verminephrobacter aporrectodeae subsp. tuberculatae]MCW5290559.1 sugar ABC transporter substrate-binding protein [Verminephrobacter aporrectodeae subsp. tuberculatae]MCW5319867.1 sugar ABC transporter substrate-binding protein [Verminephrobacter aporrectodeae subsp. tuberculatae]MCW8166743.1 sugar ABC transporter substrate-binding protein [Verminephro
MKRRHFHRAFSAAATTLLLSFAAPVLAQSPVKLQFWDMIWGPTEYIDTAKSLVAQFNKANPAIQVEYRSVPWTNWYQTYLTAINAGSAPDLSTGAGYQAVQFYDLDAIRPLDDLIAEMGKEGDIKDFREGTVERLKYKGHYIALPWGLDVRIWYYRKDLLEQAKLPLPKTWPELRAAAKAVTGGGRFGLVLPGDTMGMHMVIGAALNHGGALFTSDGKPDLMNAKNLEAWQTLAGMASDGSVSPASAGASMDEARRSFMQGKSAFIYHGPGLDLQAGEAGTKIGILPPLASPRGEKATLAWVNNIMVYKQTKNPDAVKTFVKWWSKNQKPLFTQGQARQVPARISIAEDPTVKNRASSFAEATNTYWPIARGTGSPVPGIFPSLNEVEGDGFLQVLAQRIGQKRPLPAAIDEADKQFREVLAK